MSFQIRNTGPSPDSLQTDKLELLNDLTVGGDADVTGNAVVGGNVAVTGTLAVTSTSAFTGAVSCASTLKARQPVTALTVNLAASPTVAQSGTLYTLATGYDADISLPASTASPAGCWYEFATLGTAVEAKFVEPSGVTFIGGILAVDSAATGLVTRRDISGGNTTMILGSTGLKGGLLGTRVKFTYLANDTCEISGINVYASGATATPFS